VFDLRYAPVSLPYFNGNNLGCRIYPAYLSDVETQSQ